jgi:hypothetical protein
MRADLREFPGPTSFILRIGRSTGRPRSGGTTVWARSLSISHGAADTKTTSSLTSALESRVQESPWGRFRENTEDLSVGRVSIPGINGQVVSLKGCHLGGLC